MPRPSFEGGTQHPTLQPILTAMGASAKKKWFFASQGEEP
jgi:hypothetical protein